MTRNEFLSLPRSSSTSSNRSSCRKIIPTTTTNHHFRSSSSSSTHRLSPEINSDNNKLLLQTYQTPNTKFKITKISSIFRSLLNILTFPTLIIPTCKWLTVPNTASAINPPLGRKVTGTLFGRRRGHVSFAVQMDPGAHPVLVVELAVTTAALVKEMASGLVRIALETEKLSAERLYGERRWVMYCNGRRCGYAVARTCGEWDWHVLGVVRSVSVGAGVIPATEKETEKEGELLYMRAKFERVVGSKDSEAFYMMNPDGNGGPELSIFLLRL